MGGIQLLLNNAVPGGTAGIGGTRHAENHRIVGQTAPRAGLNGGRTDFIVGNLAKQLTKPFNVRESNLKFKGLISRDVIMISN